MPDIRSARIGAGIARAPAGFAAIAQLVEHVIRNDGVGGSNPSCGTSAPFHLIVTSQPSCADALRVTLASLRCTAGDVRVMMGQMMAIEDRTGTTDRNAWARLSGLVVLVVSLTSVVTSEPFKVSSWHSSPLAALPQIHENA